MPRGYLRHWLAACSLALAGAASASGHWIIEGRIVAVADGDTITILDRDKHQHKIRFDGIDAPERKQPFGQRSRQNLSTLIFHRNVRAECHKRDRYGREVCKIFDGSVDVGP
jgi:endonuclease YncB( thermonuclease family)